jgi:hypothetical protein
MKLTKEQTEYIVELLEDKIFMDEDVSTNENNPVDIEYYSNHIDKMKTILQILKNN